MSDTDKTKPWWVRIAEHHPLAVHDRRDGICDLPAGPRNSYATFWKSDQRCYWDGAALCHWRRDDRRCTRHSKRHIIAHELANS